MIRPRAACLMLGGALVGVILMASSASAATVAFPGKLPQCSAPITVIKGSLRNAPPQETNGLQARVGDSFVLLSREVPKYGAPIGGIFDPYENRWTPVSSEGWGADHVVKFMAAANGVVGIWGAIHRQLDLKSGEWIGKSVPTESSGAVMVSGPQALLANPHVRTVAGENLIFVLPEDLPDGRSSPPRQGAMFDLRDGSWRVLPPPPTGWPGELAVMAASDRWFVFWSGHRVERIPRKAADGQPWAELIAKSGPVIQTLCTQVEDGSVFDAQALAWRAIPRGPKGRSTAVRQLIGNRLIVGGGQRYRKPGARPKVDNSSDTELVLDTQRLDLETLAWREITPPRARRTPSGLAEALLISAGRLFDPVSETWRQLPAIPASRAPFRLLHRATNGMLLLTENDQSVGEHLLRINLEDGSACYWPWPERPKDRLPEYSVQAFGDNGLFVWRPARHWTESVINPACAPGKPGLLKDADSANRCAVYAVDQSTPSEAQLLLIGE